MKYSVFIYLLSLCFTGFAQFEVPAAADVSDFFGTKTMIILEDNPMSEYNVLIKEAVPETWTITPYGFCTRKDFEEIKNKSGVSLLSIEEFYFENDKTGVKYNFLCLSLGKKQNKNETYDDIFHFPLSYFGAEEEEYMHKIPVVLRIMQEFLLYAKAHPEMKKSDVKNAFFSEPAGLKDKTLYVATEDLAPSLRDQKRFAAIYPYPFQIVSYEALEEKMMSPGQNTAVLLKTGMGKSGKKARCYKTIMDAGSGHVYYFDYHLIGDSRPDALLEEDVKKLSKP